MDFIKGNIAGYIGAFAVYPIDLIKSNMQMSNSKKLYVNGFDCLKQTIKKRGFKKLYSGSLIQIIGVGPEKAIKLFVNQTLLEKNFNPIFSGAISGLCQVIVTNPIENIKIQYQINLNKQINVIESIKMIGGIKNLYRGAIVCAMRDIPFSAIYWPTYDLIKNTLNTKYNINHHTTYLASGMVAAIPSAYLVTPFDVIKTRIQAQPDIYKTIVQSAKKIWYEEGFSAFFKGGGWRVAKSSPQFAITLYVYEMLK